MTIKISDDILISIKQDRKDGLSVRSIVEKWSDYGVTTKLVRRVTDSILKDQEDSQCKKAIDKILELAVRDVGVTYSEMSSILIEIFGTADCGARPDITLGQRSYIKSKVNKIAVSQNKFAKFLPDVGYVTNETVTRSKVLHSNSNKNNNYVYIAKVDGIPRYVGRGVRDRYKHTYSGVSNCYELNKAHFNGQRIEIEFIAIGLNKDIAQIIEAYTIGLLRDLLGDSGSFNRIIHDPVALKLRKGLE